MDPGRPTNHVASFVLPLAMATPKRQIALYKEGRLELAVQAYKQGRFSSYTAAAKAYDVPRSTLQQRINGIQSKLNFTAINRLLTLIEEDSLV